MDGVADIDAEVLGAARQDAGGDGRGRRIGAGGGGRRRRGVDGFLLVGAGAEQQGGRQAGKFQGTGKSGS